MTPTNKLKIFFSAIAYGALIALAREILLNFNIGYSPVDYGVYKNVSHLLSGNISIYDNNVFGTYVHQGLPFVYTPFAAVILYPLGWVPEPLGVLLWTFLNAMLLFYIVSMSSKDKKWAKIFLLSSFFSLFNVTAQHYIFGQINIIICFLCMYDMLRDDTRFLPKGFLIGVAAGIKLTPALFIMFFLISGRWRYLFYSSTSFVLTVIIGYIATPQNTIDYFTSKIFSLSSVVDLGQNFSTSGNSSIQGVISRWSGTQDSSLSTIISAFAVITSFMAASYFLRKKDSLATACILGIATCLLSPVSWLHHWIWIIPSIIWLTHYRKNKVSKIIAFSWSFICISQATDFGDYLASSGIPPLIYEAFRSSLVLCGSFWLLYMFITAIRGTIAQRIASPAGTSTLANQRID